MHWVAPGRTVLGRFDRGGLLVGRRVLRDMATRWSAGFFSHSLTGDPKTNTKGKLEMSTFKDARDREWEVRIDAPTILAVRDNCDARFMQPGDDENTFGRLADDPVMLCRVLFVICAAQREDKNVSEAEFYAGLTGDAIDSATEALLKAIVSFTPRRSRELLATSAAAAGKIREVATHRAIARINDPALEDYLLKKIDAEIDRVLGGVMPQKSATDSQAS